MTQQAAQRFQMVLEAGEKLLWADQPVQGLRCTRFDIPLLLFGIIWLGFSLFWEYMAYSMAAPLFFLFFGLPFVFLGVYLVIGRFILNALLRAKTFYGLTDRRVLIYSGFREPKLTWYNLEELEDVIVKEVLHDIGSIEFDQEIHSNGPRQSRINPGIDGAFKFDFVDIKDPHAVYLQIKQRSHLNRQ
ncbi:MAG: hypothetical protein OEZ39_19940 [Gammaproteobacteria bacterium]|nr:hypothetical protein [Gammaproteobacteria bacterium]MDH5654140.1 hypothetical protein [Gammaproteobacteria bacterium]